MAASSILTSKVKKTLSTTVVSSKLAIKDFVKDSKKIKVARFISLLHKGVGSLISAETNYLLGLQSTPEERAAAEAALVEISYPMMALASILKVPLPNMEKRIKLEGTRGLALLEIYATSQAMFSYVDSLLYNRPPMKEAIKNVRIPKDGDMKEVLVTVVDREANTAEWNKVVTSVAPSMKELVRLYYGFCYSLTGKVPQFLFYKKIEELTLEFPNVDFTIKVEEPETVLEEVSEQSVTAV